MYIQGFVVPVLPGRKDAYRDMAKSAKEMEENEQMEMPEEMPFAGQRLIYGGFTPIYTMGRD